MKTEDKELLLKDICSRLPYEPKVQITYQQQGVKGVEEGNVDYHLFGKITEDLMNGVILEIKLYLRPLSSMTKEEIEDFTKLIFISDSTSYGYLKECVLYSMCSSKAVDWLNKHHFDYHGLIEKGIAIEAPNGIYD